MFVHAGASIHGHEYSRASPSQPPCPNLRSPLFMRSALAAPKRHSVDGSPFPPALRTRTASDYTPSPCPSETAVVRFKEPESNEEGVANQTFDRPRSLSVLDGVTTDSELSDATESTEASPATTSSRRRRRRYPRKASTYYLGYPTPKLLAKKKVVQKVLPRLMLQLQRVFDDGRSKPVLEIFPATRLAGTVIAPRMAKRFPGIFGVVPQLHYDDLVLVRRDEHGLKVEERDVYDDDHGLEERKLLAVYSPVKNSDVVKIVLDDGALWTGTPLRNGSFDFVHVDAQGTTTTARWARRVGSSPSSTEGSPTMRAMSPVTQTRFTFSIINPLSRRHPVMATLTNSTLSIQDTFTSVSSSHARYPPSRPLGRGASLHSTSASPRPASLSSSSRSASSEDEDDSGSSGLGPESERTVYTVDESRKMLIGVTAMWVALSSGWSPNFTPAHRISSGTLTDTSAPGTPSTSIKASRRCTWSRNNTMSTDSDVASPATWTAPGVKRYSFGDRAGLGITSNGFNSQLIPRRAASTRQTSSKTFASAATAAALPDCDQKTTPNPSPVITAGVKKPTPEMAYPERRRTQSASYTSWTTPVEDTEGRRRPISYVLDVTGRAVERRRGGEKVPAWSEGEAVDDKKGVRARLTRWLHRLGGR